MATDTKKKKKIQFSDGVGSGDVSTDSPEAEEELSLQKKCKMYYRNSYKKYNNFFQKCLEEIEELQPSGFACIQANRNFTVGVLPKYCTIPDPLTRSERDRVERLLAE